MIESRPIVLDTHAWIWLMNGDEPLRSSPALTHIERAASTANVRVSTISIWEVGILEAKSRIKLPISCEEWVDQALDAPGIALASISPAIALASSRLPGHFHGDPADRILVATARSLQADLLTRDRQIIAYGQADYVSILEI
jgi:PIN domain nuclease of toxin-antitoxin system